MSDPDTLTRDEDIELTGMITALIRRWWLIVVVTGITAASLFLFLSSMDERYLSTTRILVKDRNTVFTRATSENGNANASTALDEQAIRSEVEIIGSDSLALTVIKKLELEQDPEFSSSKNRGLISSLLSSKPSQSSEQQFKTLKRFKERLTVYAIEQSRVIVVEFWSHDPEMAQKVAAELAESYVAMKIKERSDNQSSATTWLDPRIRELETAVNDKEAAVADYRASEDLLRVDDKNALLATQQLSQVSTELSRLKAERSKTLARVASIKQALDGGASLDAVPEVQQSNLIQRLREREVDLESQMSDLSVSLLPGHPRLKALQSQLSKLRAQIRNAAQDVVKSLERNVEAIRKAEADLAKEIMRLKSEAARVDSKLVELRAREREAEAARLLLAEYKSRSLEAKSREGLSLASAEIISPATYPTSAYFPKVIPFTFAGTGAVLVLTCLCIVAGSLLTTAGSAPAREIAPNVPDFEAVETRPVPLPDVNEAMRAVLASAREGAQPTHAEPSPANIHSLAAQQPINDNLVHQPAHTAVEEAPQPPVDLASGARGSTEPPVQAVSEISRNVSRIGRARIAVISPGGQPGSKSASLVARHLARSDADVVVIDFASGATTTSDMLGRKDVPGFFNLLSGSVDAGSAIHKDRHSRAYIVPAGALFPNQQMPPAEDVSDMVDAIAQEFDFCILDCGNAELEDINVVADDETIALISVLGATRATCNQLHSILERDGFEDILRTAPSQSDLEDLGLEVA